MAKSTACQCHFPLIVATPTVNGHNIGTRCSIAYPEYVTRA